MWCTPGVNILYVNDIVKISKVMELILFADDTNVFMSDSNLDILNVKLILSSVRYLH